MAENGPKLAIIGRPNVGKSTLFNRLVGRKQALVDDKPGLTRDRREGEAADPRLAGLTIIDTAGLEEAASGEMEAAMRQQTDRAVAEADLVLFVVDAREGVTPFDRHFADWLRRAGRPVLLAANKAESIGRSVTGLAEAHALGFGEPLGIAAEHGVGLSELCDAIAEHFADQMSANDDGDEGEPGDRTINLAIVGRPNVGKSTLLNALLKQERAVTSPVAGTTRDAVAVEWSYGDRSIRLVDTAGLRRRARITDRTEKMAVQSSLDAVRLAQVVVLVLDAADPFDKQDLTIARHVIDEGRALVVAVNKWDDVSDKQAAMGRVHDRLETSLAQVKGIPVVTMSALKGQGLGKLMKAVFAIYDTWNRRLSTGVLNRWLAEMLEHHPPPMVSGRRLKFRYVTQVKARPPTFALWTTRAKEVPESYLRYLVNNLREHFDLQGTPVRMLTRQGKNPYAKDSR
ncbi:MAG: ribosome biogenesis GTPase Der [Pseudomonadota bacterium]